jgi:hypothetical protein
MTNGAISPWASPCGSADLDTNNTCTYYVQFPGPAFHCVPGDQNSVDAPVLSGSTVYNATLVGNLTSCLLISYRQDTGPPEFLVCTVYTATYNTSVKFVDNLLERSAVNTILTLLQPLLGTASQFLLDDIQPNTTGPYHGLPSQDWWSLLNQYTLGEMMVLFLNGTLSPQPGGGWPGSSIAMTNIVSLGKTVEYPVDFALQIENLMVNVTLSLFQFTKSNQTIYPGVNNTQSQPPATFTTIITDSQQTYSQIYLYNTWQLWASYGPALALGVLCIFIGSHALFKNGVAGDMSFSQVLVTTRNPSLDRLAANNTLGGSHISKDLKSARVKFAIERDSDAMFDLCGF